MKSFRLHREHVGKNNKNVYHLILDHALAALLALMGLMTTILIGPPISTTPLLIFFPLIAFSAWNGGLTAGILTSFASILLLNYYPFQFSNFKTLTSAANILHIVLFMAEGIFISFAVNLINQRERIGEYKKRERELDKKILELEEKNKQYEKEIRSRDEFLSIASHELKTPLTSMLLQTQTALHNIRNVSVAQFSFENLLKMLESVENQTKRLSKMINDLLAVSVITIGNLNLEYEELDLNILTKGVLTDFQARIEKGQYAVVYNSDEKVIGNWDKIRIEQAVSNFISNAIKYGEHKPIEIGVRKSTHYAEFIIKDNGIGIPKSKQKAIFELFQRAVTSERYKGLGVGLYITQKIVSAHGGTVVVSSNPNKGSRFTMKLPLKRPKN